VLCFCSSCGFRFASRLIAAVCDDLIGQADSIRDSAAEAGLQAIQDCCPAFEDEASVRDSRYENVPWLQM